jgi:hypothetical protein
MKFLMFFLLSFNLNCADSLEVKNLRNAVYKISNTNKNNIEFNNKKIAKMQINFFLKSISNEIYIKIKNTGSKINLKQVEKIVEASYLNSWIFVDLGKNHIDRFEYIIQMAKDESCFNIDTITKWKKGQYISSLDKYVNHDTIDYGAWQINKMHRKNIRKLNLLQNNNYLNFKINKIKTIYDVMDVKTNCAARCLIETDRKKMGMKWKHIRDNNFKIWLHKKIVKMEDQDLYDIKLIEKYYNNKPLKTYSLEN